jgi:hypothetical protein
MYKILLALCTIALTIWYLCFHTNKLSHHIDKTPALDLRKFFDGNLEGWGMFFDYMGRQKNTFHITLKGTWNQNNGKLDEWFEFDDGHKLERSWNIEFKDNNLFRGTASDVPGKANGSQAGNAANIHYKINVPYRDSTIELKMDDWMYGIDDNTVMNRTKMYKWGFQIGEMILLLRKKN